MNGLTNETKWNIMKLNKWIFWLKMMICWKNIFGIKSVIVLKNVWKTKQDLLDQAKDFLMLEKYVKRF